MSTPFLRVRPWNFAQRVWSAPAEPFTIFFCSRRKCGGDPNIPKNTKTQISDGKKKKQKHSRLGRCTLNTCAKFQGLTLKKGVDIGIWSNVGFYAWTSLYVLCMRFYIDWRFIQRHCRFMQTIYRVWYTDYSSASYKDSSCSEHTLHTYCMIASLFQGKKRRQFFFWWLRVSYKRLRRFLQIQQLLQTRLTHILRMIRSQPLSREKATTKKKWRLRVSYVIPRRFLQRQQLLHPHLTHPNKVTIYCNRQYNGWLGW